MRCTCYISGYVFPPLALAFQSVNFLGEVRMVPVIFLEPGHLVSLFIDSQTGSPAGIPEPTMRMETEQHCIVWDSSDSVSQTRHGDASL